MEYQNKPSGVNVYFELAGVGPFACESIRFSLKNMPDF